MMFQHRAYYKLSACPSCSVYHKQQPCLHQIGNCDDNVENPDFVTPLMTLQIGSQKVNASFLAPSSKTNDIRALALSAHPPLLLHNIDSNFATRSSDTRLFLFVCLFIYIIGKIY